MKTTIDIPDQQLKDAIKFSKASTKREAVLAALTDYNRRKAMAELLQFSGTCDNLSTNEELEALEMPHDRKVKGPAKKK